MKAYRLATALDERPGAEDARITAEKLHMLQPTMNHEEYLAMKRRDIVLLSQQVLEGAVNPIDGCLQISDLCLELGEAGRPIYDMLLGITDQIDDLPRGDALELASAEYREKSDIRKQEYIKLFGSSIHAKCEEIITLWRK